MNDLEMIEVLQQIKICLKQNERNIALEFIELELEKLKGIIKGKCDSKNSLI